jgi:adenylate cyclase
MLKKLFLSPLWALITLAALLYGITQNYRFAESVRLNYFDSLIVSKPATNNNIHVVNIDDLTIAENGQWPFSRDVYAKLIKELYSRDAGIVIFNVLMSEPDRFKKDKVLAKALTTMPIILPNVATDNDVVNTSRKPSSAVINSQYIDRLITFNNILANVPVIEQQSLGSGITNTFPEIDGVTRRMPIFVGVGDALYPSIPLETLRIISGAVNFQVKLSELGVEKVRVSQGPIINTDALGRVWIDWSQTASSYSFTKLPDSFNNGIVIVGVSASGLSNPVATAVGGVYTQDLQAAAIGTMVNQVNIQRPAWASGAELYLLAGLGILIVLLSRWVYVGIGFTALVISGVLYGSQQSYHELLYLIDGFTISICLGLVALHSYTLKFINEFLQKQQIKKQFGTYLSPALVEKLQKNPELLQLGGESRELSIMFTDVRGFTTISEHYGKDVQGLTKIMNRYMTAMTKRIIDNNGTLDKYIGDAQMAFWNAPINDELHAKHAVETGLNMLKDLDKFNEEITKEGIPAFGMGLGINTDTVVVGNMGSDQRFDYTCLGDGVNTASRLEGQSKPYGVRIVIGPITAQQVDDEFAILELDYIAVKGKTEGIRIYTVLGNHKWWMENSTYVSETQQHNKMLELYRIKKFDLAIKYCRELKGSFFGEMDNYYDAWIIRCKEMKTRTLPVNWDGMYIATSK